MTDDVAIKVENVSKEFKLPHEKTTSIKSAVVNFWRRNRSYEKQLVLNDVSFEIKKGEFFGIVGRNGSGKSTLLKMLAGIYIPTSGNIAINGLLTPFIELGVGFNMELTGRENVYLNGALLGFNRSDMSEMYDEIVRFAELERFMDQKLKNYSSGMQVRLAFSIAIRAKSDILLIDEVLAVGDASFQQKCYDIFAELKKQGRTIVLVTHDMSAVLRFCDKAIHVNKGVLEMIASPKEVADAYLEENYGNHEKQKGELADKTRAFITNANLRPTTKIEPKSTVTLEFEYTNKEKKPTHFGFQIFNKDGVYCFGTNTRNERLDPTVKKQGKVKISFSANLAPGHYSISLATMNDSATKSLDYRTGILKFSVARSNNAEGIAIIENRWDY